MGKLRPQDPPQDPPFRRDVKAIAQRIHELAKEKNLSIDRMAKKSGGNFRSFNNWKKGHHVPTLAKLEVFAQAVGCSVRLVLQPTGEALSAPGSYMEAVEVAEYMNRMRDPAKRAEVRDAVFRLIAVLGSTRND